MVKGISRQVIVVHAPDPKLFEQAIFILKEDAVGQEGITNEKLLKEAKRIISGSDAVCRKRSVGFGPVWAACGAVLTGAVWILTAIF